MADVAYAIIGGGVIGRSVALALAESDIVGEVVVIERCARQHIENQSTRNSGVIHAGIYYRKQQRPLKARLCVEGNRRLYEFCAQHQVPHAKTGKLVVATDPREAGYLPGILQIARDNQVPNVRVLDALEVRAIEPNIRASAALCVPTSGVIDAAAYLAALRRAAPAHDLFATEVVAIRRLGEVFEVETRCAGKSERFTAEWVINAAGVHGDEVARLYNPDCGYTLVPVRGEAAKFYSSKRADLALGGRNIYPVPVGFYPDGQRADVPFAEFQRLLGEGTITETVGVHLTPTLNQDGTVASTVTIGPAITAGVGRDDVASDLHPAHHYLQRVSEFFPGLRESDVEMHQAGIQARMPGQLDWHIQPDATSPRFINLLGIDSPGMTGSLAIGRYVVETYMGGTYSGIPHSGPSQSSV